MTLMPWSVLTDGCRLAMLVPGISCDGSGGLPPHLAFSFSLGPGTSMSI